MIAILPARPDQLAEVQRVAGVIWRAHYPGIITHAQIDYMLARGYAIEVLEGFLGGADRGLLLAMEGEAIVGFGAWCMTELPTEAKLEKLYVTQTHQGRGVGGRLIAAVETGARAVGAHTLILNVNKRNAQAIAAYRKCGFAVRESVVNDIGNGFVMDDYVMAKPLA